MYLLIPVPAIWKGQLLLFLSIQGIADGKIFFATGDTSLPHTECKLPRWLVNFNLWQLGMSERI